MLLANPEEIPENRLALSCSRLGSRFACRYRLGDAAGNGDYWSVFSGGKFRAASARPEHPVRIRGGQGNLHDLHEDLRWVVVRHLHVRWVLHAAFDARRRGGGHGAHVDGPAFQYGRVRLGR